MVRAGHGDGTGRGGRRHRFNKMEMWNAAKKMDVSASGCRKTKRCQGLGRFSGGWKQNSGCIGNRTLKDSLHAFRHTAVTILQMLDVLR